MIYRLLSDCCEILYVVKSVTYHILKILRLDLLVHLVDNLSKSPDSLNIQDYWSESNNIHLLLVNTIKIQLRIDKLNFVYVLITWFTIGA